MDVHMSVLLLMPVDGRVGVTRQEPQLPHLRVHDVAPDLGRVSRALHGLRQLPHVPSICCLRIQSRQLDVDIPPHAPIEESTHNPHPGS